MNSKRAAAPRQEVQRRRKFRVYAFFQIFAAMLAFAARRSTAQGPGPAAAVQRESPMPTDAHPGFEVAVIKLSDPNDPKAAQGWSFESEGHHLQCKRATLLDIISVMYGIKPRQIVGGPVWLDKDRYDISGNPDVAGVPSPSQVREIYKKLLADRFGLRVHLEVREMPVYAVTVAKGGPILKAASPDEPVNAGSSGDGTQRTLRFTNMSMQEFARNMTLSEDRPVVDSTALQGRYDFTLKWTYDLSAEGQPDAPPSLFTAIKEQLGLRLDAVKGTAEVIVIDHLERPTEN